MITNKLIVFACDTSSTGEGNLYKSITLSLENKFLLNIYTDPIIKCFRKIHFIRDRILPFYLLLVISIFLLMKRNVLLINYVPIWNPLIFILTNFGLKIGPITGNYNVLCTTKKQKIKNYIIISLSSLSLKFLNKKSYYWVSTKKIENFLSHNGVRCQQAYPFVGLTLNYNGNIDKKFDYDIFIYTRYHINRNLEYLSKLVNILSNKYKIIQIGGGILNKNIKTVDYCDDNNFDRYLEYSKCYLTLSSEDAGLTAYKALLMNKKIIGLKGTAIESFTDNLLVPNEDLINQFDFFYSLDHLQDIYKLEKISNNYNEVFNKWLKNLQS